MIFCQDQGGNKIYHRSLHKVSECEKFYFQRRVWQKGIAIKLFLKCAFELWVSL